MSEEPFSRVEELIARLEAARARLEATDDGETAIDVLTELSEIAKEIEAEFARVRRETESGAND